MKAIIVPDLAYVSPRGRSSARLRGKLKYLQYRDDRDGHVPQRGSGRWADRGLGRGYRSILRACEAQQSRHVLAWTWVISPAPDLMALIPESGRREALVALTDAIVERYYEARGADVPAYSFVIHDRQTAVRDGAPGFQHLHTHVILPGTVPTLDGLHPFYNNQRQGHDRLFHQVASEQFACALDRLVGPRWRDLRHEPDQPTHDHRDSPSPHPERELP